MKVLLCILDGFGHGKPYAGNALDNANTPFLDAQYATRPWTLLDASGEAVGIPAGTQGGSEVGHLTMGAGRIVLQPLQEIDHAIADGIARVLNDPALAADLRQRGLKRAEAFTWAATSSSTAGHRRGVGR